jgi:hypothetical protein
MVIHDTNKEGGALIGVPRDRIFCSNFCFYMERGLQSINIIVND